MNSSEKLTENFSMEDFSDDELIYIVNESEHKAAPYYFFYRCLMKFIEELPSNKEDVKRYLCSFIVRNCEEKDIKDWSKNGSPYEDFMDVFKYADMEQTTVARSLAEKFSLARILDKNIDEIGKSFGKKEISKEAFFKELENITYLKTIISATISEEEIDIMHKMPHNHDSFIENVRLLQNTAKLFGISIKEMEDDE